MHITRTAVLCAALSAPALSQTSVVPLEFTGTQPGVLRDAFPLLRHRGGGFVAVERSAFVNKSMRRSRAIRFDENGRRLWASDPINDLVTDAFGTSRGSTVLASSLALSLGTIVSIDASGATEWRRDDVGNLGTGSFGMYSVSEAPGGDLYSVHIQNFLADDSYEVLAQRLDGATGAELWERTFDAQGPTPSAASDGDDLYLIHPDPQGQLVARALDGSGATTFVSPPLFPGAGTESLERPILHPDGGIVAVFKGGNDEDRIVRVDGAGAVLWEVELDASETYVSGAVVDSGAFVVASRSPSGPAMVRIEPSGAVAWREFLTPMGLTQLRVTATVGDAVLVTAIDQPIVPLPGDSRLLRIDANGLLDEDISLEQLGQTSESTTLSEGDALGRHYAALELELFGVPLGIAMVELVPDDLGDLIVCVATVANSTGVPGRLDAVGSALAADDSVTLVANDLLPAQPVLFLNARSLGYTPQPGGSEGILCLAGQINRYQRPGELKVVNQIGAASIRLDLDDTPSGTGSTSILAGETWYFQAWHRDFTSSGFSSNFTGAISVVLQ